MSISFWVPPEVGWMISACGTAKGINLITYGPRIVRSIDNTYTWSNSALSATRMASVMHQALKETVSEMGLFELKSKQTEAILTVLAGKDTFVSLPTGYGKSIIYSVLSPLYDKVRGKLAYNLMTRCHEVNYHSVNYHEVNSHAVNFKHWQLSRDQFVMWSTQF